ncbi:hypothetical protein TraAM80_01842 [Trypanosoma rangeli]|uniref:K Homology domain-containing protein n=1 Tax=Trypanosoma rangeli TaxID=5698 RepID=A0A422NX37_TRYRA|nr:uncharacterized protein TraAM80_01842 [Trypanosoma rangeli]RNF10093.1 hypothetical protein TraAM80_01842 [Trypanosoma rangeli]|eukprot:RNF10093.1 hypothetical protein TraAM80_01842 [Trypanosoma rangeli]
MDGVGVGRGVAVGGEADVVVATAAIEEIAAAEAACNRKVVLPYDATLQARLIGKRGANVHRIELASGACLDVARGVVTLRGMQASVAAVQELVERFLGNQHRAELYRVIG